MWTHVPLEPNTDVLLQECKGPFKDGRYFIRQGGSDPVCPTCEERRLKA